MNYRQIIHVIYHLARSCVHVPVCSGSEFMIKNGRPAVSCLVSGPSASDETPPIVNISAVRDGKSGMARVTVNATDEGSGVKMILAKIVGMKNFVPLFERHGYCPRPVR